MISKVKPRKFALLPTLLYIKEPKERPIKVKVKLTMEKIVMAITFDSVIADRARPVEKASMETAKENINIPIKLIL